MGFLSAPPILSPSRTDRRFGRPRWSASLPGTMDRDKATSHTSPDARAAMIAVYCRMPAWRKVELVEDANRTARQLALIGLRSRHPGESTERLRRRLLGLVLGEDQATEIYGELGESEETVHQATSIAEDA